jgi:hypothetical protein
MALYVCIKSSFFLRLIVLKPIKIGTVRIAIGNYEQNNALAE